eukprot:7432765-Pyramimonas_sp.AAC.1
MQFRKGKKTLRQRIWSVRRRAGRFHSIKHHRTGLKRVFRAGGMAAATYGTRVQGMSTTDLGSLRAVASFVLFGKAKGRSRAV